MTQEYVRSRAMGGSSSISHAPSAGIDVTVALHLCGRIINNPLDTMSVNPSSGIWVIILIFKPRALGLKLIFVDRGVCRFIHG